MVILLSILFAYLEETTQGSWTKEKKLMITLPVAQGGHTVFSADETGTAVLTWRVTYTPA